MSVFRNLGIAAAIAASALLAVPASAADQTPIKRTELARYDQTGAPGKEVVVYVADLAPGAKSGRHHHPGEEIVYVVDGTLVIKPDDGPPVMLHKGQVARNPANQVHNAWNASDILPAKVYVVMAGADKGAPVATPDK
jgi:quercetin dioxygenase-like cupin family protein